MMEDGSTGSFNLTNGNQAINEAFRGSLKEAYYTFVVNGEKDMLIDSNNNIITFETKLITRKFVWNTRTQKWEKMLTGVVKSKKRNKSKEAKVVEDTKSAAFAG